MGVKETTKINKENDNSFVIIRTFTHRVNAKELVKIYDEIVAGRDAARKNLDELPGQVKLRTDMFEKEFSALSKRASIFSDYAKRAENFMKKEAEKSCKPNTENAPADNSSKQPADAA